LVSGQTDMAFRRTGWMRRCRSGRRHLAINGASLECLSFQAQAAPATYALVGNGGTDSLDRRARPLSLSASGTFRSVSIILAWILPRAWARRRFSTPDGDVALDFSASARGNVMDVEGHIHAQHFEFRFVSPAIFGFQRYTDAGLQHGVKFSWAPRNVNATLGTATTNVTITGREPRVGDCFPALTRWWRMAARMR